MDWRLTQTPYKDAYQSESIPEFLFPEPLSQITAALLRPWPWRSFLWLLLSVLWLLLTVLGASGGCSTSGRPASSGRSASWWWRPAGLIISALPSFSRAACFTRRRAGGLRPMFRWTTLGCTRA